MSPKDLQLMMRMGQALVITHYYKDAIDFYKNAIQDTNDPELKLQLANLYVKLKKNPEAEALLVSEVESEKKKKSEDITSLKYKTKLLTSLSAIQERSGNFALALSNLKEAKDNQNRIIKWLNLEGSGNTYIYN